MNIKQKISMGLIASMLLPTAVSAAGPITGGNTSQPPTAIEGSEKPGNNGENTPETSKESGKDNKSTETVYGDTSKMIFHAYIDDYKSTNGEIRKILSLTEPVKESGGFKLPEMTTGSSENSSIDLRNSRNESILEGEYNSGYLPTGNMEDNGQSINLRNNKYIDGISFEKLHKIELNQFGNVEKNYNVMTITKYYNDITEYKNKLSEFEKNIKTTLDKFNKAKKVGIESLSNQINETNKQEIQDKINKINNITIYNLLKKQNIDIDKDILDRLNLIIKPLSDQYEALKDKKPVLNVKFWTYPNTDDLVNDLLDNRWYHCYNASESLDIVQFGEDSRKACLEKIDTNDASDKEQLIEEYAKEIKGRKAEFDRRMGTRELIVQVEPKNDELKDINIEKTIQSFNTPTKYSNTPNNYNDVKEDRNVVLFLKTSGDNKNGYTLTDPDLQLTSGVERKDLTISKDVKNVHGIDWNNIKSITIPQTGDGIGEYNFKNVNDYMFWEITFENSVRFYAEFTSKYENQIKQWKETKIAEQQKIADNSETSEENKQAARTRIGEIKLVSLDNIETADEDIKNQIINDLNYKNYKGWKETANSAPKLYVIAKITDKNGKSENIKVQVSITNDRIFPQLLDNNEDIDVGNYIHKLKEKYLKERVNYELSKAKYEAEKSEYDEKVQKLESEAKKQSDNYINLKKETEKLINDIYNIKTSKESKPPIKETPDADRIAETIKKLKDIEDYFNGEISKLQEEKGKLEEQAKALLATNKELEKHQASSDTLTKDQAELLKSTITDLIKAIQGLNFKLDNQGISDPEISRLIYGFDENGKDIVDHKANPNVNIEGFITKTKEKGETKVNVNPEALLKYLLEHGNTEDGRKNIKNLIENIKTIVTSFNRNEHFATANKDALKKNTEEIAKLKEQLAEAQKTDKESVGKYQTLLKTAEEKNATLQTENARLAKEKKELELKLQKAENANVKELQEKVETQRTEIDQLKKNLEDATNALKNFKAKNPDFKGDNISSIVEDLTNKLADAKGKLEIAEKSLKNIKSQIDESGIKFESNDLEGKIRELIKKVKNLQSGETTDPEEKAKLEKQIAGLNAKITELNKQIKALQDSNKELENRPTKEALDKAKEDLKKTKGELTKAQADLEQAKKDLTTEQGKSAEASTQIENLNKEIDGLKSELEKSKTSGTSSQAEVERLNGELNTAKDDLDKEQKKLAAAEGKLKTSEENLGKVQEKLTAAENQIKDKDAKIKELEEKVKKQEGTIADKDKTIKGLEGKIAIITEEKTKIVKEKEKLSSDISELNTKVTDLEKQVREKEQIISEKASEIATKDSKINELTGQIAKNQEDLTAKDKKIKELEQQIEELNSANNKKLQELESEKAGLNEQIRDLTSKNTELTGQVAALTKEKEKLLEENKTLKEQNKSLTQQLAAAQEKNNQLTSKMGELQSEVERLTNENKSIQARISELTVDNTKLQAEKEGLEKLVAKNELELKTLKEQLTEKDKTIGTLRKAIEGLTKANEDLRKTLEPLKTENSQLKEKLANIQKTYEETQNNINELNKKIAGLEATVKTQKESLDRLTDVNLKQSYEQAVKELSTANQQLSTTKQQLIEANNTIDSLRRQLKEAKNQCTSSDAQLLERISQLESDLNTSKNENAQLQQDLEKLRKTTSDEISKLNSKLGEKDSTIAELEKKLQEKEKELQKLLEEKAKSDKEKEELRKENGRLGEENKRKPEEKKPEEKKPEVKEEVPEQHGPVITNDKDYIQPEVDPNSKKPENGVVPTSENKDKLDKKIEDTKKEIEDIKDDIKIIESGGVVETDNTIPNNIVPNGNSSEGYVPEYSNDNSDNDSNDNSDNIVTPDKGTTYQGSGINPTYKEKESPLNRFGEWILSNLGRRDKSNSESKYIFAIDSNEYYTDTKGSKTSHTTDAAPFIQNDRTMFPINEISKIMGIKVEWDNKLKVATFNDGNREVAVQLDNLQLVTDGNKVSLMDSKPVIKDGRLYMSITSLNKAFDNKLNISWNNNDRTVTIVK